MGFFPKNLQQGPSPGLFLETKSGQEFNTIVVIWLQSSCNKNEEMREELLKT